MVRAVLLQDRNIYSIDDVIEIVAEFYVYGVLTDPATLRVEVKRLTPTPPGETAIYTYGGQAHQITKISCGRYAFRIPAVTAGFWAVHAKSTGTAAAGADTTFTVAAKAT